VIPGKYVLYADDDSDDKGWVSEACTAVNASLSFVFVDNGRQVLDFLSDSPPVQLPSLIVLDLNMPELDGRQTLRRLKTHPQFQEIPVAIVTTSANKIDRDVCRQLGASLFLTKPDTHLEWQNVIRNFIPLIN
jgi:CheY-like chemotaxis protein